MLNDYEITRVENTNAIHPIVSLLKLVAIAVAIVCSIILVPNVIEQVYETRSNLVDDSLKIRVVANSNTDADQQLKTEMVENLTPFFTQIQKNEQSNLENDEVYAELATYVEKNYASEDVKINIGENLIPPKLESNMFYPQYHYNSLVLTIGEGRGDNWWCTIFSNVCERSADKDKEKEEAKKTDEEEEEKPKVTFVVWEWVKKLFA
ncbi:stage II sporulation protein R [Lysinibacillus sp. SGAir0095]|uniref:stage II sporulation protein R n=1 Tax=Lysinibacillus sp. SGAir0095 TaxID=2070463 RepID=UPI0010CD1AFA|nr:stage II sporulation protein R [Lysinibacillus sp. SGAir0095]QCR31415.1 stage II sporulation protein R [Lysinibacillus sp. SGAir0095]